MYNYLQKVDNAKNTENCGGKNLQCTTVLSGKQDCSNPTAI